MIIVSQDKSEIINFDNVFKLCIKNWSTYKESIPYKNFAIFAEKNSDKLANVFLGEYDTEERAKEVLQEIINKYSSYLQLNGGPAIMKGDIDIQPNIFNIPKVYEMPLE